MLDVLIKYWPIVSSFFLVFAWAVGVEWRIRSMKETRSKCEIRCTERIGNLKDEYNEDLKELKADLKESIKLTQSMNLSLTALTSYLQGKGLTEKHPRVGE
jgi:hypothetical protein